MGLENRVAVIAGATGGLGRVVTASLAARGMRVALMGSNAGRLQALVQELELTEGTYSTYVLNILDRTAAAAAARAVVERMGRVDALFNFVGGWLGGKTVVETSAPEVQEMLGRHFWTTFNLAQVFVPHLLANQWGRIAVVMSAAATTPGTKKLPYAVGKAAQQTLMLALAEELKGTGVTANMLVVNTIDTQHERDRAPSPKNALWTTPEEIVTALLYLLSDDAQGVNGVRLPLYGG